MSTHAMGPEPANGEPNAHGATVGASGASGEPEPGVRMTFEDVIDAEMRPDEPRWRATARLLERLYPEEFAPPAGSHIDVQGEYRAEEAE